MKKNHILLLFLLFSMGSLFAQHGLVVEDGNQNNGTTGGQVVIGTDGGFHVQYDNNGIQASNGSAPSTLYQNYWGGSINMLGTLNNTGNLNVDGSGLVYINSTNRVGIGTSSPAYRLDVVGDVMRLRAGTTANSKEISLKTNGTWVDLVSQNSRMYIRSQANNLHLNPSGYSQDGGVGICTYTVPAGIELSVGGQTRFNGNTDGLAWAIGVNGQSIFRGYTNVRRTDIAGEAAFLGEMNHTGNSDDAGVLGRNEVAVNYGIGVRGEGYYRGVQGFSVATGVGQRIGVWGSASGGQSSNYSVFGAGASGATNADNNYGGYFVGRLAYTGTLVNLSDARLKTNVKDVEPAMAKINQLAVKNYEFKKEMIDAMGASRGKQTGFMAQDLQKVFPELVSNNKHPIEGKKDEYIDYLGVNYMGLIPVLTKGIQELSAENTKIKAENAELKQRLEALEAAVFNK